MKRCNAVRDALELLDWDDTSVADTRRYLLRAAFSPAFLRVPEGRRFVAFLFTLHPQMVCLIKALLSHMNIRFSAPRSCGSGGPPSRRLPVYPAPPYGVSWIHHCFFDLLPSAAKLNLHEDVGNAWQGCRDFICMATCIQRSGTVLSAID